MYVVNRTVCPTGWPVVVSRLAASLLVLFSLRSVYAMSSVCSGAPLDVESGGAEVQVGTALNGMSLAQDAPNNSTWQSNVQIAEHEPCGGGMMPLIPVSSGVRPGSLAEPCCWLLRESQVLVHLFVVSL